MWSLIFYIPAMLNGCQRVRICEAMIFEIRPAGLQVPDWKQLIGFTNLSG